MTNNELSRKVLEILSERSGSVRFKELVEIAAQDARSVFKNLFFLEERGYVQLSTSSPADAVYPQIHLVRLREKGKSLLEDHALLDATFPLSETAADLRPHIPPDLNKGAALTFANFLELFAAKVRADMGGEDRDAALEKIEWLLGMPFINQPLYGSDDDRNP
jgi:hypothetical protein